MTPLVSEPVADYFNSEDCPRCRDAYIASCHFLDRVWNSGMPIGRQQAQAIRRYKNGHANESDLPRIGHAKQYAENYKPVRCSNLVDVGKVGRFWIGEIVAYAMKASSPQAARLINL